MLCNNILRGMYSIISTTPFILSMSLFLCYQNLYRISIFHFILILHLVLFPLFCTLSSVVSHISANFASSCLAASLRPTFSAFQCNCNLYTVILIQKLTCIRGFCFKSCCSMLSVILDCFSGNIFTLFFLLFFFFLFLFI